MLAEVVESLSARLALAYWCTAFAALLMRLFCPEFTGLSSYGVRSAVSSTRPHPNEVNCSRDGEDSLTALMTCWSHWCAPLVHWLASSVLGRCRVTRKQSFTAFYVTGLITSLFFFGIHWVHNFNGAVPDPPSLTCVPLLLFAFHCAVRLFETCFVQRFQKHDTVTLFAAVAGCTFYVMAAVSSAVPIHSHVPSVPLPPGRLAVVRCIFGVGAMVHLSLQAIQVAVHTVLALLQQSSSSMKPRSGKDEVRDFEEGLWRRVQAHLAAAGPTSCEHQSAVSARPELHGAWRRYRYPYYSNVCFQVVLDPHYTCEVAMYAVNTILILLCVLSGATQPTLDVAAGARRGMGTHHLTSGESLLRDTAFSSEPWLSVLASAGLTVFTAANLSITSAEHRRFWVATNATRRFVSRALQAVLREQHTGKGAGEPPNRLPAEVVCAGERLLQEWAVEEVLPRWNVLPFVW
ncbi:hypothetical protein JKF63_03333 [Porcisia hertigi]|uniref:Polyprenol reductase n=1 Tax=Porcisia hertigi TaxID=2761500 RepID=A0A836I213_9TRYP|nr:hypothetical protein JKF63_03333 [Porcisia hertigi]